eukprot:1264937-Rhodomonas_salina.2
MLLPGLRTHLHGSPPGQLAALRNQMHKPQAQYNLYHARHVSYLICCGICLCGVRYYLTEVAHRTEIVAPYRDAYGAMLCSYAARSTDVPYGATAYSSKRQRIW